MELTNYIAQLIQELEASPDHVRTFGVRQGRRTTIVDVDEVFAFTARGNYIHIHTDGAEHVIRETMGGLERRLDPREFIRIHRSAIVRIRCIAAIESIPFGEYHVLLQSGMELNSSRPYRARLERACGIG